MSGEPAQLPSAGVRALHVAGLTAFAISQPLLDLLANHTEFLVAHRLDRLDLLGLAVGVGLGVPLVVALVAWGGARLAGSSGWAVQLVAVGLLAALVALPLVAFLGTGVQSVAALAVGALTAAAYASRKIVRLFATALAVVVPVFVVAFAVRVQPVASVEPAGGWRAAGAEVEAPVVVVLFDALPLTSLLDTSGEIDARRLPNFAALASGSHWFRNTTTVAERTTDAIPALLTGRYPVQQRPATLVEHPQNLFTLLSDSHALHAIEPFTALCPPSRCGEQAGGSSRTARWSALSPDLGVLALHKLLPLGLREGLPDVTATWRDFAAARAQFGPDSVRRRRGDARWVVDHFVAGFRRDEPATLHFLHLNLPHRPYRYLPSGIEYGPAGRYAAAHGSRKGRWLDDPWQVSQALQRHLLQLGFADTLLGEIVARLVELDLYDRAVLVVAADHGVSFRAGASARQVGPDNAADILSVPLFVKLPGQSEGARSDRNVETIDVLPTIVAALGGSLPEPVDGVDALGEPPRAGKKVYVTREAGSRRVLELGDEIALTADILDRLGAPYGSVNGDDLYAIGPHRELIGVATERLGLAPPTGFELSLAEPGAFEQLDPAAPYLPVHVAGQLRGPAVPERPVDLALAVGGTIRGVTRSYDHGSGSAHFSVLLPPEALSAGTNRVEMFVVHDEEAVRLLAPISRRAATRYAGVAGAEGQLALLYRSDGRLLPYVPALIEGGVERDGSYVQGTARDVGTGGATDALLVFEDGRLLYTHPLALQEEGGAALPKHQRFRFPLPTTAFGSALDVGELRFLAVTKSAAGALDSGRGTGGRAWPGAIGGRIETREDGSGLALDTGAFVPLREAELGWVDVAATADGIALTGRVPRAAEVTAVAVFVAGTLVSVEATELDCAASSDAAAGRDFGDCSFRIGMPIRYFEDAEGRVRVTALADGSASEMRYGDSPFFP